MATTCPNTSSPDWVNLVQSIGEQKAYDAYTLNGDEIPSIKQARRLLSALNPVDRDKDANRFVSQSAVPDLIGKSNAVVINQARLNDGVSKAITRFLNSTGVQLQAVDTITDSNGAPIPALAKAEMVQKAILFSKGRLNLNLLGEEAAHFYVEMLDENSPLYKEMYNAIDKYDVYNQVVNNYSDQYKILYGEDAGVRLRKEAMGQLIASHIVGNTPFESGPKQSFAVKWWDKVVNFVQSIFGKVSPEAYTKAITSDAYYRAAQNLLTNNQQDLDLNKNLTGTYFNLTTKQKEIVDQINQLDSDIHLDEATHTYTYQGKTLKESVTDIVNRLNPFRGQIDPAEKAMYSSAGTRIHGYIQNAIQRAIEAQTGNQITQPIANNTIYDKLYTYMSNLVNRDEFRGGVFLTEKKVIDAKRGVPGTIDLMIVMPDGKVHLFDWKSINFKTFNNEVLDERVSPTKERNYNIQLREYKNILVAQYGVKEFGQIRVIPIQTIFKSELQNKTLVKGLNDIKIGGEDRYLQPIISESEKTGIPALDNLLNALIVRRHALENTMQSITGTDLERAKKRQYITSKLVDIAHAITQIHVDHKIDQFLDFLSSEIDALARHATGSTEGTLDALTDLQFEETSKNINYFQTLIEENLSPIASTIKGDAKERLRQLATRFVEAKSQLYNDLQRRLNIKGEEVGINNVTEADKQTGWWSTTMRYASQQFNKKIATLWKLVDNSKQQVIKDHTKVNQEIEAKVKALKEWGSRNSLSGVKVFSKIINKDGTALIAKFDKAFRDKVNEAYDNPTITNIDFLRASTNFDEGRFERDLAGKVELWRDRYGDNQDAIDKHIRWYEKHFDVRKSDEAYGKNNYYLSLKDEEKNHSAEYKYIYQKGNEPLRDFYEYFIARTSEYRDIMGLSKDRNFIWNVRKDFVEKITSNGIGAFTKMPSVINQLEQADIERSQEVLTDESGQQIQALPKYFIQPILKAEKQADSTIKMVADKESKSQDLGKVLSLAAAMSLNYKYMSDIEDSAKVLRLGINYGQEIVTDYRGRPVQDLIKGGVKTAATSASTIQHFNDVMNYYLYGVKNKTKDITFDFLGKKRSLLKGYSDVSKYFTGKTLGFNTNSILANIIGGDINARILGTTGKYFDNKQYSKALYHWLPMRDPKAYTIMGYFDIMTASKVYEKANELSASNLTKHLTWDKLFIGHEKTDSWIRNSALLAMMQNYTINDSGNVVKKTESEKSLYDMVEIKDGKFSLPNLSEDEYNKFRNKVHVIGERLLGNSTRDNIRGANLTILGRSLMMFRSWIPRMADERFGELRQDYDLNEYEYGRYRAFGKAVFQDQLGNIGRNLMNTFTDFGILGFKPWKGENAAAGINARIDELYYKAIESDPTLDISKDEFHQLYKDNLRTSMMEFQVMATLGMLLLALKGAVGKDKSPEEKFALSVATRSLSEMAFFSGLGFNDIVQNAVPIMTSVQQLTSFGKSVFIDAFGGPQPKSYKNSLERGRALFPILYAFDRLERMFEKGQ